ncbi:hypothetical protein AALP_AA8G326800 [Arabis alpina]|uniref:Uncharacterized protein n=1 Tax=Arabis alpina TaxID=50452 RepID=A0A087GAZ2_ARAAL|nr:hypothetical protein AALP_AA8G326800 [Arabis alpina]
MFIGCFKYTITCNQSSFLAIYCLQPFNGFDTLNLSQNLRTQLTRELPIFFALFTTLYSDLQTTFPLYSDPSE